MTPNTPFFADLSTYHPQESISFYQNVFGWSFYESHGYYTAYLGTKPIAGLYETPDKFKQMRMPHFWMTYISVNSVDETVSKARASGGIIEMQECINDIGKVALIRDPQGAGFTVYEGNVLQNTRNYTPDNLIWNELHISNTDKVLTFYQSIFNWSFQPDDYGHLQVWNTNNEHIANILEIPNIMKGKYEYWVSCFGVSDLNKSRNKVLKNGGCVIFEEDHRILVSDNSGEAFFFIVEI
ncbi:MAG: VOC family protein [Bacteroidales bacterium]|nr:VOC family protein [Bacteroidales bacterium]